MSPPTEIDGSEIQEATIDAQNVTEITIDGQKVFSQDTILESFERSSPLSIYSGDTGEIVVDTSTVFDGSKSISGTAGTGVNAEIVTQNISMSSGNVYQYRHFSPDSPEDPNGGLMFGVQGTSRLRQGTGSGYKLRLLNFNDTVKLKKFVDGNETVLDDKNIAISHDPWMKVNIEWNANGDINISVFDNNSNLLQSLSANDSTFTSGGIGWENFEGDMNFDFLVEKA